MNNYKKQPFIPAIQKTSTLVFLSLLSLVCFLIAINTRTIDVSGSYEQKVQAAELMSQIIEKTVKTEKARNPMLLPNQVLKSIICRVAAGRPAPSCE